MVGTSTGAILAIGMGLLHYSLEQCEAIYTGLGHKVFNQVRPAVSDLGSTCTCTTTHTSQQQAHRLDACMND